jgi:hypothetical protein
MTNNSRLIAFWSNTLRARFTRYFGSVKRTLRRETTLLSAAWHKFTETLMAQGGRHRVIPAFLGCRKDQPVCPVTTVQP